MRLRWRCLLLDHDDTAVDSTREVHYPAHLEAMRTLRPARPPEDLDGWFLANFDPGIEEYLGTSLGLDETERMEEFRIWRRHNEAGNPRFFPGFLEVLRAFRDRGGKVAVISHSERDVIERHYKAADDNRDGTAFLPDLIFGWEHDPERRKPNPWPVREALRAFAMEARDALIVDDLKPGVLMGKATGVAVAAAGWGHRIPAIRAFMQEHCTAYLETVDDLRRLLFG